MEYNGSDKIKSELLPRILNHLVDDVDACACFFVNFKAECEKYFTQFKQLLCEIDAPFDGLSIHGDMAKEEKFAFINLFTGAKRYSNLKPRILFATSAANTGIDQLETNLVAHVGLFRCLITMLQERGRNARRLGMIGAFIVFGNWRLFIKLLLTGLCYLHLISNVLSRRRGQLIR